jgi:hypothetical protein
VTPPAIEASGAAVGLAAGGCAARRRWHRLSRRQMVGGGQGWRGRALDDGEEPDGQRKKTSRRRSRSWEGSHDAPRGIGGPFIQGRAPDKEREI